MLEKQHRFFDLVQRLLNPTLVLKSNRDSNEEGPMLVTFEFIPAKLGSAKMWQVAQRLLSTVTPLSEY